MNNRRKRSRRPARRPPFRDPKPLILVLCEGENTEPEYLNGFKRWVKNPRVDVEIADEHGVPMTLVKQARDRKKGRGQGGPAAGGREPEIRFRLVRLRR